MKYAEVEESVARAKQTLEQIMQECGDSFIAKGDHRFVETLLWRLESYVTTQADVVNLSEEGVRKGTLAAPSEMKPYQFSASDTDLLARIVDHSKYYKEHGEVRYRLRGQLSTPSQFQDVVEPYIGHEFSNPLNDRFLRSILFQLHKTKNLSALQVKSVENILDGVDGRQSGHDRGEIYFNPKDWGHPEEDASRIINYALGKGMGHVAVSGEDIIALRNKYLREGKVDLTTLREEIKRSVKPHQVKYYMVAIRLLDTYLNSIDPKLHDIDRLYKATPKKSSG